MNPRALTRRGMLSVSAGLLTAWARGELGAAETAGGLRLPAATAYVEPDPLGARVTRDRVGGWSDPANRICWYGRLRHAGALEPTLEVELSEGERVEYRLDIEPTAGGPAVARETATGKGPAVRVSFPRVRIDNTGYYRFQLVGISRSGSDFGRLQALALAGPAVVDAQFNTTPRRNAASVHLWYPVAADVQARWFYNELTVDTDPLSSYYMACGFHRGYFGIQVNSPTERRIIFSVWDSGNEAVDRNKVQAEDRVQLLSRGDGVVAHGFGNEGTGGHSHLVYPWQKGIAYRFLIAAEPEGQQTIYTAYFFFPERNAWGLIARFRAPKDGGYLRGLYSFDENFVGHNGQQRRAARFGNGWVRDVSGQWHELTEARFTHDAHGRTNRRDYEASVQDGRFLLATGGFQADEATYGMPLRRPGQASHPSIDLPAAVDSP